MDKLNKEQKKSISSFLNNTAVAWFATGVVGPIFSTNYKIIELALAIFTGTIGITYLLALSIKILENMEDD